MNKFSDIAETLFKAGQGEGAKGGHVIGHTKSGKPIYASSSHPEHAGFSAGDHTDAMNHHYEIWSKTQSKIAKIKEKRPNWNPPKEITSFLQHHHSQMQMHQVRANRGSARQEAPKTQVVPEGTKFARHPYHTPRNIHKGLNDMDVPSHSMVVIINSEKTKVLLGERYKDDEWTSPGGSANIGEHPEDTAIRECFEESGIALKVEQLEELPMLYNKKLHPVYCYMAIVSKDQVQHVESYDDPSQEIRKWKWYELDGKLPDPLEDNRYNAVVHAKMKLAGILMRSFVPMDNLDGMAQMHTTEFATESSLAPDQHQRIENEMKDYKPGDLPVCIGIGDVTNLYLVKIDDGIYSGFAKKVNNDGLEENVAQVDKMTIPAMIQFLRAKQVMYSPVESTKQEDNERQLKIILEALSPKVDTKLIYVSMDGDNIGNKVAQAEAENDEQRLTEMSHKINAGQSVFGTWVQSVGGSIIESGGDEGLAKVPASAIDKIENFRSQYMSVSGATVTVGIGDSISDSTKARQLGKLKGKNKVEFFGAGSVEELKRLLKPVDEAQKIIDSGVLRLLKGSALPVGSVRIWNGQHFRKEGSGHWIPVAGANGPTGPAEASGGPGGNAPDATAAPSKAPNIEQEPKPTKEVKPEAKHLKHLLPKEGMGGHVTAHSRDLKNALERGPVSIISAGRNNSAAQDRGMTDEQVSQRSKKLEQDLKDAGLKYMKVKGKYNGGSEDSFAVFHADPEKMNELGKKYNQDSVIHTEGGKNRLHYTTGENEGKHHKGSGHVMVPEAEDNFSEANTSDGKKMKFNLGLDFGKLHEKD